ncbi:MAG: cupin domain-containing protein [Chloroflexia bacterium]|jgi:predicted cupin superfamily sugar epimerase|nr:cupin domain-containing protein [Chloroflexia bacterium]
MPGRLTAGEVIDLLGLAPMPGEGGFFRRTVLVPNADPALDAPAHTAILYLISGETWSGLHMLQANEVFHFYLGDACRMVVCSPDGVLEERRLGTDLRSGCQIQTMVPAGTWQGTRLMDGGEFGFALLGTTMTPGFRRDQFRLALPADLESLPPNVADTLSEFLSPEVCSFRS